MSTLQGVEEEDASQLKFGSDFVDAQCLLNSEVSILLQQRQDSPPEDGLDVDIEPSATSQSHSVFTKTLNYAKRFGKYKNKTAAKEVRNLLTKKQLEQYEIASLANLTPQEAEEAKILIPSLTLAAEGSSEPRFSDAELMDILNDLKNYTNL
ncbi:hypothetical protein PROFUN_09436 [Planoprotostelium fungivorum]|uniref:RNA polymerase Rpb4/RPC9 core domain-containing protein n=1 Tax=Planoprotostelium fungivorum TaxID=1890364 RepID=A0A2P6NGZ9_9EUKA|nr:hypothetical protein PROFUN_09436 [Planoprotostelium fungivorum]